MATVKSWIGSERHRERVGDLLSTLDVPSLKGKKVLVTGGGGFFGIHLARALHMLGCAVVITDKGTPIEDYSKDITFVQGDIRDRDLVEELCKDVNCVFHIASFGMSGAEMMKKRDFIESINVGGTENVIEACIKQNVARLVYTSTINVVLGSKAFDMATEAELPRIPPEEHADDYSRTKSIAEVLVLKSNGRQTQNGEILHTCAIRPPGIYGAGEQRHFSRIVGILKIYKANLGSPDSKTNWVHVDNLVNGHLLAADGLSAGKNHISANQAYFITDQTPINNCLFFKPIITGLGYTFPDAWLPLGVLYCLAFLSEIVHFLVKPFYNFVGFTRTEMFQAALHHTVSYEKAQDQLGYQPLQRGLEDSLAHLRQLGYGKDPETSSSWTSSLLFKIVLSITIIIVLVAVLL
ncbi:short-chain dehydrogenase/reductase family 42E member 1-like [Patiria miniata]|uniref:3-beta hydroxysteroid dehydrogenase/isomerase domain-containing protein n=1 Tax=Patiria miniata TaxID=46514 RepID=A0A914AM28_PATMI|nr:short-chain dehydrogenase/reductase family 42E member 1-like [Patiria miniata]